MENWEEKTINEARQRQSDTDEQMADIENTLRMAKENEEYERKKKIKIERRETIRYTLQWVAVLISILGFLYAILKR